MCTLADSANDLSGKAADMTAAKKTVAVRLSISDVRRLEEQAAIDKCSVSDAIRKAIARSFEKDDMRELFDRVENRMIERFSAEFEHASNERAELQRFVQNIDKNVITTYRQIKTIENADLEPVLEKLEGVESEILSVKKMCSSIYSRVRKGVFGRIGGV